MLKTRYLKADNRPGPSVAPFAFADGTPDTATYGAGTQITLPELALEFYVDGRRHLLRLTDAQAAAIARTAARAFDDYAPEHPTVFDIELSRARQLTHTASYRTRAIAAQR